MKTMARVFTAKLALVALITLSFQTYFLVQPRELDSANLTSVKDTLSTSRLSYYDSLNGAHTAGTTIIKVNTSGMPSTSTANLFTGDSVLIGDAATATTYTVDDIIDTDEFQITGALGSGDNDSGDLVIATRSATHTLSFTTATAIPNGAIRILIPSGADGVNDGIPNHDGFDFNGIAAGDLTAPTGGGVTSWEPATATAAGGALCAAGNHCFEARYNGTNSVNAALTFTIGDGGATDLINPTRGSGSAGSANTYTVTVQHLGSRTNDYPVVDSTTIKVAVIESVRVTATVDPTITFTIAAVNSGTATCGITTDITTTATAVPFGTMALNTFKTLAQTLTVSTNGSGGYAVTTIENDQLGKDGGTTPFIADTSCDAGPCTASSAQDWVTSTNNGFGYSLDNDDAASIEFQYNTTGTFDTRQFPATADAESAQRLFYSGTVANAENADVCYRLSIGATQAAGDYENNITYTATATF